MEKVASCMKFSDKADLLDWLSFLPRKYALEDIENLLTKVHKGQYILWTKEWGLKIK